MNMILKGLIVGIFLTGSFSSIAIAVDVTAIHAGELVSIDFVMKGGKVLKTNDASKNT